MKAFLSGRQNNHRPTACIVDGKLILSFPNAKNPVVWQMDMRDARASALEVRKNKKGGDYLLVLKTQAGDKAEIAPFEKKEDAVGGLIAITEALHNAHGKIRAPASDQPKATTPVKTNPKRGWGKWAMLAGVFVALVVALNVIHAGQQAQNINTLTESAARTGAGQNTASQAGVPVSADEFLRNR